MLAQVSVALLARGCAADARISFVSTSRPTTVGNHPGRLNRARNS